MSKQIRIDSYLGKAGMASRREAQRLLKAGYISVNGQIVIETVKVDPDKDVVKISKEGQTALGGKETVLINKPRGVVSSKDTDGTKTVFDRFPQYKHLNCVGRLDKESDGLLLLSNDGLVTNAVTGKHHSIEKEYIVKVREDVMPVMIEKFKKGFKIIDGFAQAVDARKIDKHTFSITLNEGRKHQIRRMANGVRLTIESLTRVRIGFLEIKKMRPGQSRPLSAAELERLKSYIPR